MHRSSRLTFHENEAELVAREVGCDLTPANASSKLPLDHDQALMMIGARCRRKADRTVVRSAVRSVQIHTRDATISGSSLDLLGPHGLRGATPDEERGRLLLTTGEYVAALDVASGAITPFDVRGLADIHEMTLLENGGVLVANSGHDQVVQLDGDGSEVARVSLDNFRSHRSTRPINHRRRMSGLLAPRALRTGDYLHVNQALIGADGHRLALVHHLDGFQPVPHAALRLVGQGRGGLLDLDTHRSHPLYLRAPHSVRAWGDDSYVVLDSGGHRLVVLDRSWNSTSSVTVPGWGRGADVDSRRRVWIGISATRRRYVSSPDRAGQNAIVVLDHALRTVARRRVRHVDEVWAVHVVAASFAARLIRATSPQRDSSSTLPFPHADDRRGGLGCCC